MKVSFAHLEIHPSFKNALVEMMAQMGRATPCLIDPIVKINDIEELKIKRQKIDDFNG